ncbi:MAG: HAD family hydrolase [Thiohalophilus sp.]|uniref:histidinol-phosphatase n=1 Tax=Thiohalophilus sp. TaxID=3028392 RepID=UPI0028700197|nr:HAD family hydrolase [Thiohalophilus sp.]MDR9437357.1 HAD family hydrolase [Thiohalophilus sp.]
MTLAIFDLDNTLLNGDSDYLWGRFLVQQGRVDGEAYERENHRFYEEYKSGQLDIREFLAFSLRPLSEIPPPELIELHRQFMDEEIRPRITPAARALLDKHRARDDFLLIITATNRFVTEPIAEELGVDELLATDPEQIDGRYTGQVSGIPCFREGKVQRLEQWLKQTGQNLADSWFYSDSHNDLPLLERVTYPVAVDPDETLTDHASARGWPILSLRE